MAASVSSAYILSNRNDPFRYSTKAVFEENQSDVSKIKNANLLPVLRMCLSYKHFTSRGTLVQTQ